MATVLSLARWFPLPRITILRGILKQVSMAFALEEKKTTAIEKLQASAIIKHYGNYKRIKDNTDSNNKTLQS